MKWLAVFLKVCCYCCLYPLPSYPIRCNNPSMGHILYLTAPNRSICPLTSGSFEKLLQLQHGNMAALSKRWGHSLIPKLRCSTLLEDLTVNTFWSALQPPTPTTPTPTSPCLQTRSVRWRRIVGLSLAALLQWLGTSLARLYFLPYIRRWGRELASPGVQGFAPVGECQSVLGDAITAKHDHGQCNHSR